MREVLYKKSHSLKRCRKVISVREISEDKECRTVVGKSFIYKVRFEHYNKTENDIPQIFIRKQVDYQNQFECFIFKVKGSFSLKQGRQEYRVDFCHILKIKIYWKIKVFSPKKSGTLT